MNSNYAFCYTSHMLFWDLGPSERTHHNERKIRSNWTNVVVSAAHNVIHQHDHQDLKKDRS